MALDLVISPDNPVIWNEEFINRFDTIYEKILEM
jgi:hypothetical protein